MTHYWLMKTEAAMYGIDDLQKDGTTEWTGVRNYQARNHMMNMQVGDMVLFYHSVVDMGVYGVARVVKLAHPDSSQFDPSDEHYDPKSKLEKPMWHCVDLGFVQKFKHPVSLETIKADPNLDGMVVRQRGSRLSVQPVSREHFDHILSLAA